MRSSTLQVQVKKESDEKELKEDLMKINSKLFEKCHLDIRKRKMVKRYTCKEKDVKINDDERIKIAPTFDNDSTIYNQTTYVEDEYVSSKEDLPVLDSPNTQTVIYQKDDHTVCFKGNGYEDTGKNKEIKVPNSSFDLSLPIISSEHSDDSNDLDFDNTDMF